MNIRGRTHDVEAPTVEVSQQPAQALLPVLACALTVALFLLRRGLEPVSDPDVWLHLRVGSFLLTGGRFGSPDPWAPAATSTYQPSQWLPEIAGAWTYSWAGLPGIAILRFLGILVFFGALLWLARTVADPLPATMAALAGWIAAYGSLAERPQLVSFILLTVTVRAWWDTFRDGQARWWLVPLTWLWAACHGLWVMGVGLGFMMVVARIADRPSAWRRSAKLLFVPLASLAAAGLTPLGPAVALNPFRVHAAVSSFVQEWQPPTVRNPLLAVFLGCALVVVVLWSRAGRTPPSRILLFIMAVLCALWMARLIAVGAILLAPLFAEGLQSLRHQHRTSWQVREIRLWGLIAVLATVVAVALAPAVAARPGKVPTSLTPALGAIPAGTIILSDHALSGWLMWTQPELKEAFDLRSEIYSAEWIRKFQSALAVRPGWRDYVADTHARYALLPDDSPLGLALGERLAWRRTARGQGFTLWARP